MKVANKKCIRRIAWSNMKSSKTRNTVAVVAIALTSILFTVLFTISLSIVNGFQEASFRQVGTYAHGAFSRLYKEQYEQLKEAPEFSECGARILVGRAEEKPFNKANVEISYCDKQVADYMYITPEKGALPKEGSREAAADTKVLKLLGVKPVIGSEFRVSFKVNNQEITRTYTLSGYWEADNLAPANHILIPQSEVEELLEVLDTTPDIKYGHYAGTYDLYFMLDSSSHIEKTEKKILKSYGYQCEEPGKDNYINAEENVSYAMARLNQSDAESLLFIFGMAILIIFTGYLVIHSIFRIATVNDIRRYGLLKTVGTTKRQIRRIVYMESFLLAGVGIVIGLVIGYGIGALLTPVVIRQLNGISMLVSTSPVIFLLAAAFSLFTVFISSMKPARIAAKVSPIEALRYTEQDSVSRKKRRKSKRVSEYRMACSNVGRNKAKTITTMLSLTLAVLVLNITYIITNSFDMDKYMKGVKTDCMVANANYFQVNGHLFSEKYAMEEEVIQSIKDTKLLTEGGRTFGIGLEQYVYQYVPKENYISSLENSYKSYNAQENIDYFLEHETQIDGRYESEVNLYGMDDFCLEQADVVEGDLSKLNEGDNYIAAVYEKDDYGRVEDSNWAKVGDTVTIRYANAVELYNPDTGEVYDEDELDKLPEGEPCWERAVDYHDVTYTVCAAITLTNEMSYRYHISDEFVLPSNVLLKEYPQACVMYYAYNLKEGKEQEMEKFISDYTTKEMQDYDYESKLKLMEDLDSYKQMFLILGSVLSLVIGIIGIINFLNVNLTSIFVRRREFAILQSVGMTGRQLKKMLAAEGLIYAVGSILLALVVSVLSAPAMKSAVENLFWFCNYQNTYLPIICLIPAFVMIGVGIPVIVYHFTVKKSIVERLL